MEIDDKYISLIEESSEGESKIFLQNSYAWELSRINTLKAFEIAEIANKESYQVHYQKGIADSHLTIGQCYWLQGDYSLAIKNIEIALKAFKELKDEKGEAEALNLFGGVYSKMEDFAKAISFFESALKIRDDIQDIIGKAKSLNSIGDIYMRQKDYQKAMAIFESVLEQSFNDDMYRGIITYNLSECLYHMNQLEESLKQIAICEKIGRELNFALMQIYCTSLRGKISLKKNDFEEALNHLKYSLALADEIKMEERVYHIMYDISLTQEKIGDFQEALNSFKKYHSIKEKVINKESSEKLKSIEQKLEMERLEIERENEKLKHVELQKAYKLIEESRDKIANQNKEIKDSINYAKRIQRATLPTDSFIKSLLPNSFVIYNPKDVLSGDFYWLSQAVTQYKENLILAAVVDCTGHGVPGAMMSIIGNNLLRLCEHEESVNRPSEALNFINNGVSKALRQDVTDESVKDGMDMAFIAIDYHHMKLHFSGAKSPIYRIRNKELLILKGDNHPIGKVDDQELKPFYNNEIDIEKGDLIYLFTDGYADQFGGPKWKQGGKKFKYNRFRELLISISEMPMSIQRSMLMTAFNDWKGELDQVDDVCIMGIQI